MAALLQSTLAVAAACLLTTAGSVAALKQASANTIGAHISSTIIRDKITPNSLAMRSYTPSTPESHTSIHVRRRSSQPSANLTNVHDIYYMIDLKVGSETIPVSVDTGSSDTWLIQEPYTCVSYFFNPGRKPDCGFGPGLKSDMSSSIVLPNTTFGRAYGDGTFVRGYFVNSPVTIGGLTIPSQRLAVVNYTYWYGDNRVSGLLGLGYPLLTSLDSEGYQTMSAYDPIFFTLWKERLVTEPVFSIALSRDEDQTTEWHNGQGPVTVPSEGEGGKRHKSFLALGGLPDVGVDESTWARTPIQSMDLLDGWDIQTSELGMYIIVADAYVFGKTKLGGASGSAEQFVPVGEPTRNTTRFPVLIDAGSTLSILPRALVDQLYASFDPPAKYMPGTGLYYARCDATVPTFGVQIGTSLFSIEPEDLLRQNVRKQDEQTGEWWCRIGVTDSYSAPYILGVTFLSNVVAVFDVGKDEMRFATRTKY
ncbi:aspartic protease PEP3 [Rhypophila decipiens]|uniref:Aspartic protease PEP3 n=1 Tax=Rhypophila decipiens TaxID=261697 RepID=A0AAN6Y1I1_9PEZI|nr:aspartic protease PEP3 [Rhypophila decipiens]